MPNAKQRQANEAGLVPGLSDAISRFDDSCKSVIQLRDFDQLLMHVVVDLFTNMQSKFAQATPNGTLKAVENAHRTLIAIKDNESLGPHYESIHNQCIVLLVSHFTSALKEMLVRFFDIALLDHRFERLGKQDFKLSVSELREASSDSSRSYGDIFLSKRDVSFQNLESIDRLFRDSFGVSIEKDPKVQDLILAMEARHCIVHSGSKVERKTAQHLRAAPDRSIKPHLSEGDRITFTKDEINLVLDRMKDYLNGLSHKIATLAYTQL